ncbi:uncharacterized protein LOC121867530 [Homarus americanus]|uniref:uncharacterized protein LOC121867530 n=1 Tax=Homarus americanus TaxID=6706 RepID=UPI001C46E9F9|nr:uncharacterized protein LOC121867530 [Homarus americanus]
MRSCGDNSTNRINNCNSNNCSSKKGKVTLRDTVSITTESSTATTKVPVTKGTTKQPALNNHDCYIYRVSSSNSNNNSSTTNKDRDSISFIMSSLFSSVTTMFAEADREFDQWRASNKDLQQDIEEIQKLVRALTKSANDIHHECTKPREMTMRGDPTVKLRVGNTKAKASLWEEQEAKGGSVKSSGYNMQRMPHCVNRSSCVEAERRVPHCTDRSCVETAASIGVSSIPSRN